MNDSTTPSTLMSYLNESPSFCHFIIFPKIFSPFSVHSTTSFILNFGCLSPIFFKTSFLSPTISFGVNGLLISLSSKYFIVNVLSSKISFPLASFGPRSNLIIFPLFPLCSTMSFTFKKFCPDVFLFLFLFLFFGGIFII